MFSNRRIRAALGRTINLGNFESVRVDIEISADIQDGDDVQHAQVILYGLVEIELEERVKELTPKKNVLPRGKVNPSESYVP